MIILKKSSAIKPAIAALALVVATSNVPWTSLELNTNLSKAAVVEGSEDATESVTEETTETETEEVTEEKSDNSNTKTTNENQSIAYSVNGSKSIMENEDITYTIDKLDNSNGDYLYGAGFIINFDDNSSLKSLNIGKYENAKSISVLYKVGTLSTAEDAYNTEDFDIIDDEDISEDGTVKLPDLKDGERIDAIYIQYDIISNNFKLTSPVIITASIDTQAEQYVAHTKFIGLKGETEDPNNPTAAEISNMSESVMSDSITTEFINTSISSGSITSSAETLKYREQFSYNINGIENANTLNCDKFNAVINLSEKARLQSITTPLFDKDFTYSIMYSTIKDDTLKTLAENLSSSESKNIAIPTLDVDDSVKQVVICISNFPSGAKCTSDFIFDCINWSDAYDTSPIESSLLISAEINGKNIEGSIQKISINIEMPEAVQSGISRNNIETVTPGQKITYTYQNVLNSTEKDVSDFAMTQTFTKDIQPTAIYTGTYDTEGTKDSAYSILYQLNTDKENTWHSLTNEQKFDKASELEVKAPDNGYITAVKFLYGNVNNKFTAIECPQIDVSISDDVEYKAEIKTNLSLEGTVNGENFSENKEYSSSAIFGWINIEAYDIDTGKKIKEIKRITGAVDEAYNVDSFEIIGYRYIKMEGKSEGKFKEGLTDTVKVYYKVLPKTGEVAGNNSPYFGVAALLSALGVGFFIKKSRKHKEFV